MELNLPIQTDDAIYSSLPTEVYSNISLKTIFKLIITSIIIFAVLNIAYHFYLVRYDMTRTISKWELLYSLDEPVDVLIFGDSVALSGIDPEVIEAETGLSAINLALNGRWVYYHDIWTLEYYLNKFGAPKAIIWGHLYQVPSFKFNAVDLFSSSTYPFEFALSSDYTQLNLSDDDLSTIRLRRLFPLYFRDDTSEDIVSDWLSLKNPIEPWAEDYKGFLRRQPVALDVAEGRIHKEKESMRDEYFLRDEHQVALSTLFDILEQNQIPTYTFITPVHDSIGIDEKFLNAIQKQREYLYNESLSYDMVTYNAELPTYDATLMYDGHHLNISGATVYTQYLVDWIWGDYEPQTMSELNLVDD
jgi:hypothetical protein